MTRDIDPVLAESHAARLLSEGLGRASEVRGLSQRKIAGMLGYKQAVVLSHMASGRVPIPIDRAEDIAAVLEIDVAEFLRAVLRQRHPSVSWSLLTAQSESADPIVNELAVSLGKPVNRLSQEQRGVMREVAADPRPRRRWLTVHELTAVSALREVRPNMSLEGLTEPELESIREVLKR